MHDELDQGTARLLAAVAEGLPITLRPYADLGARVGMSGAEVLVTLRALRDTRAVRRVGAVISPFALGYVVALGAAAVPEERLDDVASILADVPNVTHAFEMDDRYRLWFVLAAPSATRLEIAEGELTARLGAADRFRVLDAEEYLVTHAFDADGVPEKAARTCGPSAEPLDRDSRALVRLLQGELPLVERPFSALAATLSECGYDADEQQVLEHVQDLARGGVVRGIAVTMRTRVEPWRLALAVWVNPHDAGEAGHTVSAFPEVVHCFDRRVPGGGKAIVAVVETPDRSSLDRAVERIRSSAGLGAPRIAYPLRELKRAPMRYFSEGD